MTQPLDILIAEQEKMQTSLNERTFWRRNKKLLIIIGLVLIVLWIFSISYVNYWLPRVYEASSSMN